MPYVRQDIRHKLEIQIESLMKTLAKIPDEEAEGALNYAISRIVTGRLIPLEAPRYIGINRAIGVLECAKQELYRRVAVPYEDLCITKNGDLPEYH